MHTGGSVCFSHPIKGRCSSSYVSSLLLSVVAQVLMYPVSSHHSPGRYSRPVFFSRKLRCIRLRLRFPTFSETPSYQVYGILVRIVYTSIYFFASPLSFSRTKQSELEKIIKHLGTNVGYKSLGQFAQGVLLNCWGEIVELIKYRTSQTKPRKNGLHSYVMYLPPASG